MGSDMQVVYFDEVKYEKGGLFPSIGSGRLSPTPN